MKIALFLLISLSAVSNSDAKTLVCEEVPSNDPTTILLAVKDIGSEGADDLGTMGFSRTVIDSYELANIDSVSQYEVDDSHIVISFNAQGVDEDYSVDFDLQASAQDRFTGSMKLKRGDGRRTEFTVDCELKDKEHGLEAAERAEFERDSPLF